MQLLGTRKQAWFTAVSSLLTIHLVLFLTACTRSSVPIPTPADTSTPEVVPTPENTATPEYVIWEAMSAESMYAVVWVSSEENLPVRQSAGISGTVVDTLPANQRQFLLTGNSSMLGSSLWVEIERPNGGAGWVNAWFLTEDVQADVFCEDVRVLDLLAEFRQAVLDQDGNRLGNVLSPKRDLVLRHNWWNPEIKIETKDIPRIFLSLEVYDWGMDRSNDTPIVGTFSEVFSPRFSKLFGDQLEISCNTLEAGDTAGEVFWPEEFQNLNFYSLYRPAMDPGSRLDWITWVFGIEYVRGEPFIAVMIQYIGEI
jgi:hypothetical protein